MKMYTYVNLQKCYIQKVNVEILLKKMHLQNDEYFERSLKTPKTKDSTNNVHTVLHAALKRVFKIWLEERES